VTDYSIQRGPWGKPWITRDHSPLDWGPDEAVRADRPLNGHLYDRVSDLSGNLDTKENLSPYHQAQAVMGMMMDRALAVQFKALMSEHGLGTWTKAKGEVKDLLKAARAAGGEEFKSGMGTGLHRYTMLRDKGIEPEFVTPEFEPWLDCYEQAMNEAKLKVLDWEQFVVTDDLENPGTKADIQVAGSFDKLVENTETGEVMIADFKSGKDDNRFAMKPTIQITAYAHGEQYDQETGRRWPIHDNVSLKTGLLIHAPFNGGGSPECTIYPLDLERGWELATMSRDITEARKMRVLVRDALARVKA